MRGLRAWTPGEKRVIVERLYAAWLAAPALRLGQLLMCALNKYGTSGNPGIDIFYVEDSTLATDLETWHDETND